MLTLDGIPLLGDNVDSEVQDFIQRFIPTSSYMPWLTPFYPGWNLAALTSVNGYQWGQKFKLNRLYWPSGASRFAYGHWLANSDTVDAISQDAYGPGGQYVQIPLAIGNPESNAGGTIIAGETFQSLVYMLPPRPLSGIRGLSGMIQSLYLITTVDERYFWMWQNMSNTQISSSTTWTSLLKSITTTLGVTVTVDTISPNYLAPSVQAYSVPLEPIPIVLDSICYNIGMRFVALGLQEATEAMGNTYAMQLYNTALTSLNSDMSAHPNRMIVAGGQSFSNPL
jgi:hypothetical protein